MFGVGYGCCYVCWCVGDMYEGGGCFLMCDDFEFWDFFVCFLCVYL